MDEVFGVDAFVCEILVKKKGGQKSSLIDPVNDYILWYGKTSRQEGRLKYRAIFERRELDYDTLDEFSRIELPDGSIHNLKDYLDNNGEKIDFRNFPKRVFEEFSGGKLLRPWPITNGGYRENQMDAVLLHGESISPPKGRCWSHVSRKQGQGLSGMQRNLVADRLIKSRTSLDFKRYLNDFPYKTVSNWWDGLGGANPQAVSEKEILRKVAKKRRFVFIETCRALRDVNFSKRIFTAYAHRCAMCGMQLRLLEGAHILPVADPNSTDETSNGIALCALHHKAYDDGLLTFDDRYRVHLNTGRLKELKKSGHDAGLTEFRKALRSVIRLPPDSRDRPRPEYVKHGNKLRGWAL
jgi:hypothetical protein